MELGGTDVAALESRELWGTEPDDESAGQIHPHAQMQLHQPAIDKSINSFLTLLTTFHALTDTLQPVSNKA